MQLRSKDDNDNTSNCNDIKQQERLLFRNVEQDLEMCTIKSLQKIQNCRIIQRLLIALSHYQEYDILKFSTFMNQLYKHHIIDDLNHLQKCHDDQLPELIEHATVKYNLCNCNIDHCSFSDIKSR